MRIELAITMRQASMNPKPKLNIITKIVAVWLLVSAIGVFSICAIASDTTES
jgi:hypothetical protein